MSRWMKGGNNIVSYELVVRLGLGLIDGGL